MTNKQRAKRARDALRTHCGRPNARRFDPCELTDLLADLYHAFGPDAFENAARIGRSHYKVERADP